MLTTIGGTSITINDERAGLAYEGTFGGGTLPTTASLFAPGCRLTNNSNGDTWRNIGTTAVPVWSPEMKAAIVNLTAANLIAMYATPVEVVAAVPGYGIVVDSVDFIMTRTATAFTSGGVVAVQYAATANGAGTATHATIAAAVVTGAAGTTYTARIPVVLSDIATASISGIGLFISNQTAAFATGTGTAVLKVRYHLI